LNWTLVRLAYVCLIAGHECFHRVDTGIDRIGRQPGQLRTLRVRNNRRRTASVVGGGAMVLLAPISQVLAGGPLANPIAKCVQGKMETFNGLQVFPAGPVKVKMTGRTSVVLTTSTKPKARRVHRPRVR